MVKIKQIWWFLIHHGSMAIIRAVKDPNLLHGRQNLLPKLNLSCCIIDYTASQDETTHNNPVPYTNTFYDHFNLNFNTFESFQGNIKFNYNYLPQPRHIKFRHFTAPHYIIYVHLEINTSHTFAPSKPPPPAASTYVCFPNQKCANQPASE